MVGWHHWINGHEFQQALGVGDTNTYTNFYLLNLCSPWGRKVRHDWVTDLKTIGGTNGKEPTCQYRRCKRRVWFLGWEDPQEEGMATYSNILAWRIPWTEEPVGLQSISLQRLGHDWSDLGCTYTQDTRKQNYL